jgi:hypothetical protein
MNTKAKFKDKLIEEIKDLKLTHKLRDRVRMEHLPESEQIRLAVLDIQSQDDVYKIGEQVIYAHVKDDCIIDALRDAGSESVILNFIDKYTDEANEMIIADLRKAIINSRKESVNDLIKGKEEYEEAA